MNILQQLNDIFTPERVLTDEDSLQNYGKDWTQVYTPDPLAIVFPTSTEEVQALVKMANEEGVALVPSGGRTGLCGGAVAMNQEIVVSFDRMNKILDFNSIDRSVVCQPGVITQQLQNFAEENNLFYPVDFGSSGSSQLGGNISTNAGGIKVVRYGLTRNWVLGLKVVTGAGEVLDLNHGLVKNATGYDFRHLFIGAEGTLGFITEATMRLTNIPKNLTVFVLGVTDIPALMQVFETFQNTIELSAFEFFSEDTLSLMVNDKGYARPFDTEAPYYALIQFEVDHESKEESALQAFEACAEEGWVVDGVMSQSLQQAKDLWRLREDISETISAYTPYKNDLSVNISKVPEYLDKVEQAVNQNYSEFKVLWYGHIGDGNLHLNILKPESMEVSEFFEQCSKVNPDIFEVTKEMNGSVSAEHGIGIIKKNYLKYSRSKEEVELMASVKKIFDPNGIINPGKIF